MAAAYGPVACKIGERSRQPVRILRAVAFEADLAENLEFIAADDPVAATKVLDAIEDQSALLVDNPELGRPGRVASSRELVIAGTRYIVAYRVKGDEIQLLRLLHGAQRWPGGM